MAELTFQQHMEETGAQPGYYSTTIFGGSHAEQGIRQRVFDHSSALFAQGYRWADRNRAELWLGSTVRTYWFHSETGKQQRAFVGTFKRGREIVTLEGSASSLDAAQRIMQDEMRQGSMQGHNVKFFGVQWKSKVEW